MVKILCLSMVTAGEQSHLDSSPDVQEIVRWAITQLRVVTQPNRLERRTNRGRGRARWPALRLVDARTGVRGAPVALSVIQRQQLPRRQQRRQAK